MRGRWDWVIRIVIVSGVAAAVAGFFLPWAYLRPRVLGKDGRVRSERPESFQALSKAFSRNAGRVKVTFTRDSHTMSGNLADVLDIPPQVTGAQIPIFANHHDRQLSMAVTEMATHTSGLGRKSYFLYLIPVLALLSGLLLIAGPRRWYVPIGAVCLATAIAGFWQLAMMEPGSSLVDVTFGPGLWVTCWAFGGLGAVALLMGAEDPDADGAGSTGTRSARA